MVLWIDICLSREVSSAEFRLPSLHPSAITKSRSRSAECIRVRGTLFTLYGVVEVCNK